jgi:hypothetical protein
MKRRQFPSYPLWWLCKSQNCSKRGWRSGRPVTTVSRRTHNSVELTSSTERTLIYWAHGQALQLHMILQQRQTTTTRRRRLCRGVMSLHVWVRRRCSQQ